MHNSLGCSSDVDHCIRLHILSTPPRVAVLQEITSFSPTYSQVSGRLHPSYTYTTPLLLSDIAALCYCGSLSLQLSALAALCLHGSLPSWLSALPSISLTLLLTAGAAQNCRRMLVLSSPLPRPVHSQGYTFNPQSRCPPLNPSLPSRVLCFLILHV